MNDKKRPYTALLVGGLTAAILTAASGAGGLRDPMIASASAFLVCALLATLWISEDLE